MIVDDSTRLLADAAKMFGAAEGLRWGVVPQLDDEIVACCAHALRGALTQTDAPLTTVTKGAAALLADLRRGNLDIVVVTHPAVLADLDAGPVITLNRTVVVPSGHRAAKTTSARAQMLRDLALATAPREDNPPAHDLLTDGLRRHGLDVVVQPASSHREVSAMVAAGTCFGLATASAAEHTGTTHLRMLVEEVALRVRIVAAPGRDLGDLVYTLDRELLRSRS
ncbi:LysR family transcriptional regulator [Mycobacterium crocinum]|uniref:LysR substrate-binding domain-containing protein n=1 Tax=Mycolicibacterium crocinum TaxID=388459 RepID=A0ABY3THC9_9MYCO|nr:LysR substrate-binding domain-containing protein [Mycolicibacterium crocinum]MCV7219279.1 LysR family transcriptional regulator [Mycolicibacterium crocinum]ULN39249.1 LysR substrate-binding domain-containing protein [Mycolicibacterium crocinum]